MTGYGKAEKESANSRITIEIRALNSRGLDLSVYLPKRYSEKEHKLRKALSSKLIRGKVAVSIKAELRAGADKAAFLNEGVADHYIKQLTAFSARHGLERESLLTQFLRLPEILSNEVESDEAEWQSIEEVLQSALNNFIGFRQEEGKELLSDLSNSVEAISARLERVSQFESERLEGIKDRIKSSIDKIEGLAERLNADRFEQEMVYYVEKLDINEEKSRLRQHCKYFLETAQSSDSNGRKLGFIAQEMGREINTLGSKANHVEIQKLVVEMKEYLDKIKEQILNAL